MGRQPRQQAGDVPAGGTRSGRQDQGLALPGGQRRRLLSQMAIFQGAGEADQGMKGASRGGEALGQQGLEGRQPTLLGKADG
ncbi:hypothetical protein D3C85_1186480 [compost metagenome]